MEICHLEVVNNLNRTYDRPPMASLSLSLYDMRGLALRMNVLF